MTTEIERARELLASSEELLERSRNRPRVSSSFLDAQPERRTVEAPIVRKVRPAARVGRTMDAATQAGWDAWATSIAQREARVRVEALAKIIGSELIPKIIDPLHARIAELEQRTANLERAVTGEKVIEWPLRTGTGG